MSDLKIKLKRPTAVLLKECREVMTKLFRCMARGDKEIYFGCFTQGMWDIKTQLELNLTTAEHFGNTFFWHKMDGTRKCAVYTWKGDHLHKMDGTRKCAVYTWKGDHLLRVDDY